MFLSTEFIWNNIDSSELGLVLITMDSDILNNYSFPYSEEIETENSFTLNPFYKQVKKTPETINLKFCLVDSFDQPMVWDEYKTEYICNTFITKDFKPFISYDNLEDIYYLKVVKIDKVFSAKGEGYLDITFQPYTQYTYRKQIKTITVNGNREITITNYSNVEDFYAPIIEIENLGDSNTINTIQNTSIQNISPLEITQLNKNEKIIIDNLYCTVLTPNGTNKFMNQNRKWIKLKQGSNKLKFTGNCVITIKSQYPIKK